MRPPSFWYQTASFMGFLLSPLGLLYGIATAKRVAKAPTYKAAIPVICIGNINAGGTGKTPTTIAIADRLSAMGQSPHIVSRGYGGTLDGPVQVNLANHSAAEVGDEPLMLSAFAPTWVSTDRALGVKAAENAGASVILLDDGFQNPAVFKSLQIVVVDAVKGFGNGRVLPAGPLREPAATGLKRADILLVIGPQADRDTFAPALPARCLRLNAQLDPLQTGMPWHSLPVLAFAGIGHPEKFFATLKSLGAKVVKSEALDDHQPYTKAILTRLEAEAASQGLQMVTTEKDAMRLPDHFRAKVAVLPVRLSLEEWDMLDAKFADIGLTLG